jgi:hypothetical protein
VPTGALTNIALAVRKEPRIASRVREVVLMGGGYHTGNWSAVAEFNIKIDPEAAHIVFNTPWPLTMVGLDLTHQALATPEVQARIAALATRPARFVQELLLFFGDTYRREQGFASPPVHDPCAVAYVIDPQVMTVRKVPLDVELQGALTLGMTVADFRQPPAEDCHTQVAVQLDQHYSGRWWKTPCAYRGGTDMTCQSARSCQPDDGTAGRLHCLPAQCQHAQSGTGDHGQSCRPAMRRWGCRKPHSLPLRPCFHCFCPGWAIWWGAARVAGHVAGDAGGQCAGCAGTIGCRAATGAAGTGVSGPVVPVCLLMLYHEVDDPQRYGLLMGVITAVNGGIAGIDAIAGGWLATAFGFRAVFWCIACLLRWLVLVAWLAPESRPSPQARMDWPGVGWLVLSLGCLLWASAGRWPPMRGAAQAGMAGMLGLGCFCIPNSAAQPLLACPCCGSAASGPCC